MAPTPSHQLGSNSETESHCMHLGDSALELTPQEVNKCTKVAKHLGIKTEEFDVKKEENEYDGNGNSLSRIDSSTVLSTNTEIKPFADTFYNPEINHTTVENVAYQDAQSAQNQHISMTESRELERRLGIKLEEFEIKKEEDECDGYGDYCPLIDPNDPFDDVEVKPFLDTFHNPKANHVTIESGSYQNASEIDVEYPDGHKLTEEEQLKKYRCNLCSHKTKLKANLMRHMLTHKDISEVKAYQCKLCPYKTKWQNYLATHVLIRHRDASEVTTYNCKLCPYKSKLKEHLKRHMLTHQDISEVTSYQCEFCPYKTKWKGYLSTHILIHQDSSVVPTYECEICHYKTKRKGDLAKHVVTHQDPAKVPAYRCKICPYESKRKRDLTRHALIHQNVSKITKYKCKICPFKTKWKCALSKHVLIHRDDLEGTGDDSKHSPYRTKRKGDAQTSSYSPT